MPPGASPPLRGNRKFILIFLFLVSDDDTDEEIDGLIESSESECSEYGPNDLFCDEEEDSAEDQFGDLENDYDSDDEDLYPNCGISRKSFTLLLKIWAVKHAIADKAMDDLLKVGCQLLRPLFLFS